MSNHPYYRDTATEKRAKISDLLRIVIATGVVKNEEHSDFLEQMQEHIDALVYRNYAPTETLTERQSAYLRSILYKNQDKFDRYLPSLPDNVDFKDEVRRLLKKHLTPSQVKKRADKAKRIVMRKVVAPFLADKPSPDRISARNSSTSYNSQNNAKAVLYFQVILRYGGKSIMERDRGYDVYVESTEAGFTKVTKMDAPKRKNMEDRSAHYKRIVKDPDNFILL